MFDPVTLALIIAGAIIVIGFLSNYLLERKGLPDMLFLIVLGMLVGPATGLVDAATIMGFAPYLAVLALVFILFDGGMTMNIYHVFSETPRAAVLAAAGFTLSTIASSLLIYFLLIPNFPFLYALLFGTIVGGSSSIIVMSLASRIKLSEKGSTLLRLESALNDILCIVLSLVVIEIITLGGTVDIPTIARSLASRFSIGAMLGIVIGIGWLSMLKRIVKASYSYMLTLGIALLAYALSEILGGSGALCSLLFGLMLGNEKAIYGILRMKKPPDQVVDPGLKRFESEIAFLLRAFFFVYIGLIVTLPKLTTVIAGIILALSLLLIRYGVVNLATIKSKLTQERGIMSVLLTRGLASAVLATLTLQYADPVKYPNIGTLFQQLSPLYISMTVVVILATALIATVGIPVLRWRTRE
ncbi:cation:proton antiporter [Candidatus Bathyarchaeota archaeon]|nr:cation:proton antiporter [Candidatus Bathyarchaeota archaeon]